MPRLLGIAVGLLALVIFVVAWAASRGVWYTRGF